MTQAAEASATGPRAPGHPAPGTGGPHPAERRPDSDLPPASPAPYPTGQQRQVTA